MPLWAIKYVDIDDRWWMDLVYQDQVPDVTRTQIGSRVFTDGFQASCGWVLVKKLSVPEGTLADWPADAAIALRPGAGDGPSAA